MARTRKPNGTDHGGNGGDAPNDGASSTRLDRLPSIAARIDSATAVSDDARSELGNIYQQAENDGFHRRALKEAVRLRNMEADKRRDYLSSLNAYCDKLGIWNQGELFGDQPGVPVPPAPLNQERAEAERDPLQAGRQAGLHGFSETRNPFPHPSVESADWLRGHAEGEAERRAAVAATSGKRRRRGSSGADEAAPNA